MSSLLGLYLFENSDIGEKIEDEYGSIGGYFIFLAFLAAMVFAMTILIIPFAALGSIAPMIIGVPLLYGLMALWWLVIGLSARFATTLGAGILITGGGAFGTLMYMGAIETNKFIPAIFQSPPTIKMMWIAGLVGSLSYFYLRYTDDT